MSTRQKIALFVLLLAGFMTIFDLFVVNVAIVSIEKSLRANLTELTLIIVGYELAFGLLLITGARLGDIFGKRTLYKFGMLFFIIASGLCAISTTAISLVITRFIQGLAAGCLFPQVYASIRINFDESQSKTAFGYLGMTLGLAAIAGQVLGGWLIMLNILDLGWRTIFLINIPIGILGMVFSRFLLEGEKINIHLDCCGIFLSSAGIASCLLPFLMLPVWGWGMLSTGLLCIGLLLLLIFICFEIRLEGLGKAPLFSMKILLNRRYLIGLCIIVSIYATSSAFPLLFAIFLQKGLGLTAFGSGLIFMPASVGFVLSSFMTPYGVKKYGEKVIFYGAIFYGLSYVLLIWILNYISLISNSEVLLPILFLIGFTQGMIMTPMLSLVLSQVSLEFSSMASGLAATVQKIGAAIGATAVAVILQYALQFFTMETMLAQLTIAISASLAFNVLMACGAAYFLWLLSKSY